jgi:translocation protein SEC66
MTSVIIPIAYLVVIFGGLYVFSVLYRRHTAGKSTHYNWVYERLRSNCSPVPFQLCSSTGKHVDPYYESHPERDAYVTLLQQDPPAPEVTLKAALMRRAIADVFAPFVSERTNPRFRTCYRRVWSETIC